MLETIREYAREKLEESGAAMQCSDLHSDWFLALAEQADADKYSDRQVAQLAALEDEHANFRAALVHLGASQPPDREIALVAALGWFWLHRGHWREAADHVAHALSRSEGAPVDRRAFLLVILGSMRSALGDNGSARQVLESSVELLRGADLPSELSRSLSSLGHVLLQEGEYEDAEASFEEALELARVTGSDTLAMLINLSIVYLMRSDARRAAATSEDVLAVSEAAGDVGATIYALENLAHAELMRGDATVACGHYVRALRLAEESGEIEGLYCALEGLSAAIGDERPTDAAEILGASEKIREQVGGELQIFELQLHDQNLARLRQVLGEPDLSAALARGRERSPDQAVQHALASID
jgi:tetratricopeptide (TPR) repeat protein